MHARSFYTYSEGDLILIDTGDAIVDVHLDVGALGFDSDAHWIARGQDHLEGLAALAHAKQGEGVGRDRFHFREREIF